MYPRMLNMTIATNGHVLLGVEQGQLQENSHGMMNVWKKEKEKKSDSMVDL